MYASLTGRYPSFLTLIIVIMFRFHSQVGNGTRVVFDDVRLQTIQLGECLRVTWNYNNITLIRKVPNRAKLIS